MICLQNKSNWQALNEQGGKDEAFGFRNGYRMEYQFLYLLNFSCHFIDSQL